MITAVDTSVLLDVFRGGAAAAASEAALVHCLGEGDVVACDVVWAEVAGAFPTQVEAARTMAAAHVGFSPLDERAALAAGSAWAAYRRAGGARTRVVADFLIGAHALRHADRLLTRDRGFQRKYFRGLKILDPSRPPR